VGANPPCIPACTDIALGKTRVGANDFSLAEFALKTNSVYYKQWPKDGVHWLGKVIAFLNDGKTRIYVNLDGIGYENVRAWAKAGEFADPKKMAKGLMAWELYQIRETPSAWSRITWYEGGVVKGNPFE
jgi:hypothetical protein